MHCMMQPRKGKAVFVEKKETAEKRGRGTRSSHKVGCSHTHPALLLPSSRPCLLAFLRKDGADSNARSSEMWTSGLCSFSSVQFLRFFFFMRCDNGDMTGDTVLGRLTELCMLLLCVVGPTDSVAVVTRQIRSCGS
jgi:hypothetical protein